MISDQEILKLLDESDIVEYYEILDFKEHPDGFY